MVPSQCEHGLGCIERGMDTAPSQTALQATTSLACTKAKVLSHGATRSTSTAGRYTTESMSNLPLRRAGLCHWRDTASIKLTRRRRARTVGVFALLAGELTEAVEGELHVLVPVHLQHVAELLRDTHSHQRARCRAFEIPRQAQVPPPRPSQVKGVDVRTGAHTTRTMMLVGEGIMVAQRKYDRHVMSNLPGLRDAYLWEPAPARYRYEESAQSQYCMNLVEPIRTLTVDWAVGTAKFSINVDKPGMGLTKKVAG